MIGAIAGDIIGSVYEFDNIKTTVFPLFTRKSNYTDDTIMTVAVTDWLLYGGNLVQVMHRYGREFPCPMEAMEHVSGNGFVKRIHSLITVGGMVRLCGLAQLGGLLVHWKKHCKWLKKRLPFPITIRKGSKGLKLWLLPSIWLVQEKASKLSGNTLKRLFYMI